MSLPAATQYRLLPLQQGMVLHLLAQPGSGIDIQQCIARVREPLDMPRFTRAWQSVMDRHDGLRTSFHLNGLDCVQSLSSSALVQTTLLDWRDCSEPERASRFERFLEEDRARGLDLTHCPTWRVTVFDCADDGFRFVFTHPLVEIIRAYQLSQSKVCFYRRAR